MSIWLKVILFLIANWKDIYSLVMAILKLIGLGSNPARAKELTSELVAAVREFKSSGDKKPLEALLCKIEGNCKI